MRERGRGTELDGRKLDSALPLLLFPSSSKMAVAPRYVHPPAVLYTPATPADQAFVLSPFSSTSHSSSPLVPLILHE